MEFEAGARIQTNREFEEFVMHKETLPWRGKLIQPFPSIAGCWVVRFDHIKVDQFINQFFFETEQP